MTCIPLELEKQNKDFRTLHEQANKMVYSFNRFESSVFKYWPYKNLRSFFPACVILRIIFKFRFSQYACLCKQVGFLLRRSHIDAVCMDSLIIMNHGSGVIIKVARVFAKTLIECIPKSTLESILQLKTCGSL